jgi:MinD superfamily P-loop ATPase
MDAGPKAGKVKELLVISGKGGTGKTTVLGSFAALAENAVLADCDVDAANLHLLLQPYVEQTDNFYGLPKPHVEVDDCISCGVCTSVCRYNAIRNGIIDPFRCESCGVCVRSCRVGAIGSQKVVRGHWYTASTQYGPLVYARLHPGEENSGLLVAEVKKRARELAKQTNRSIILTDGPPGIGCPAISALSGADLVLLVAEPTISGCHDLQRVIDLIRSMRVPMMVCINKADLHSEMATTINRYCDEERIPMIGRVPFDAGVYTALTNRQPAVCTFGPAAAAIRDIWKTVAEKLVTM